MSRNHVAGERHEGEVGDEERRVGAQLVVRRVFGAAARFDELRDWLVAEWRKPAAARDFDAAVVFAELELEELGLGRRHLLESERFRSLLELQPALARAA